jgi:acylphosphatase
MVGQREQKRVVVHGRVQGVGYRLFTRELARSLQLTGTVRNLPDGERVEVVVQGPPTDVARLIAHLQAGPPGAVVHSLDVTEEPPDARLTTFDVTR